MLVAWIRVGRVEMERNEHIQVEGRTDRTFSQIGCLGNRKGEPKPTTNLQLEPQVNIPPWTRLDRNRFGRGQ